MEGPFLPAGSGGAEPPEEAPVPDLEERVRLQQEKRMFGFEKAQEGYSSPRRKRRHSFDDYAQRNCEEASAERLGPA